MARQAAANARKEAARTTACRCGHLKYQYLDERVIQRVGERSTTHTSDQFRRMYMVSPCKGWPPYRQVTRDMGIPIPGHKDSSNEEESDDKESNSNNDGTSGYAVVHVPHAVDPSFYSTNQSSTGLFTSRFHAFAASLATRDRDTDTVVPRFSTNEPSNKHTAEVIANAATTATDSSKKQNRCEALGHRPVWLVRVEPE